MTNIVRKVYVHAAKVNPKVVVSAAVITWGDGPHTDEDWFTKSAAMLDCEYENQRPANSTPTSGNASSVPVTPTLVTVAAAPPTSFAVSAFVRAHKPETSLPPR